MIYVEMTRDEAHGGGTWAFTNCVWAPTEKKGGGPWAFWNKILRVREGDTILHLRGIGPQACFVGYSIASSDGFETTRRPPDPKEWDYAERFYRADLSNFTQFHQPIFLTKLFAFRRTELEKYFNSNKPLGANKANIFFVRQSGRLQCLNGAYLSDVDETLLEALFGIEGSIVAQTTNSTVISVETGFQITTVRARLGQSQFSSQIKKMYSNRCCFPKCQMTDPRFLVGSHIARWCDNEALRGHMGNGLCLCLLHDKAFEIGLFTLDEQFRIFVNPRQRQSGSCVIQELLMYHGEQITLSKILPLDDALLEHWIRVGIEP